MGYRVVYRSFRKTRWREGGWMRILLLTLLCFSLFLSVVFYRCTEVRIMVQDAIASLHPTVVVSAMNDLANSFENGVGLFDTVKEALHCNFAGGLH